ncbi:MAG TPA: DUF1993 domain-containing protein [Caulobacteraceae bacterium]|jgi:hypothetical protein
MTVSLFSFINLFDRQLTALDHILKKGQAHAEANGVSETGMLAWRLIDDMQPLAFQIMVACNFSRQWTARTAGLPLPGEIGTELSLKDFLDEIAASKTYLASLTPEQFAGRDDVPLTHEIGTGMVLTLPCGQWLTVFAATNLFFHVSTAYDILRANGVPIGKIDLFAAGV